MDTEKMMEQITDIFENSTDICLVAGSVKESKGTLIRWNMDKKMAIKIIETLLYSPHFNIQKNEIR